MEVVKNNKEDQELINKQLKGLFERKATCEFYQSKLSTAISVYNSRYVEISNSEKPSDRVELFELETKLKDLHAELMTNENGFSYVKKRIKSLAGDKFTEADYIFFEKNAKKDLDSKFFEEAKFMPENIELPKSIRTHEESISLREARLNELVNQGSRTTKEEIEAFELRQQLISLKHVHKFRLDNYNNVFLPKYKKDMEERKKYLDIYLGRAKVFNNYKVDPALIILLQKRKENSNDKRYEREFWTTLKKRVDEVSESLKKDEANLKNSPLRKHVNPIIK